MTALEPEHISSHYLMLYKIKQYLPLQRVKVTLYMSTSEMLHCDACVTAVYVHPPHDQVIWGSSVIILTLLFFRRCQRGDRRDFRFPFALADPPPPYSLCITGLATHNRWLSLFSSPQSRLGQVLCYLLGGRGGSGPMLNFTPHGLRISETRSWWTGGGGGGEDGAVYWCLTSWVCLYTLRRHCPCFQLWSAATVSTLMNMPVSVFQW